MSKARSMPLGSAVPMLVSLFATLLVGRVSGEYDSSGSENFASRALDGNTNGLCTGSNCGERGSSISGAMWFGPRLGRRRRSETKIDNLDDDQMNAISELVQAAPWTLFSLQGLGDNKRHASQFTPRLGRETGDDLVLQKFLMGENARLGRLDDILDQRQPPPPPSQYPPRLGRQLPFEPRLGRQLRAILQKL